MNPFLQSEVLLVVKKRPYLVLGRSTDTASGSMSKLQTETVLKQLMFHYTKIKTQGLRGKTSLLSAHFLVILKVSQQEGALQGQDLWVKYQLQ